MSGAAAANRNGRGDIADLQRRVDAPNLAEIDCYVLRNVGLEARCFDRDTILPGRGFRKTGSRPRHPLSVHARH